MNFLHSYKVMCIVISPCERLTLPVVWAAIKSDLIGPFTGPFEAEK